MLDEGSPPAYVGGLDLVSSRSLDSLVKQIAIS